MLSSEFVDALLIIAGNLFAFKHRLEQTLEEVGHQPEAGPFVQEIVLFFS